MASSGTETTADNGTDRLSEYERAVFYYTLPKVIHPITYSVIGIYALLVVQAIAAIAFGLATGREPWVVGGSIGLAAIVVLGGVGFTVRALLNEVRQRNYIEWAHRIPDAVQPEEDMPDPFAAHQLLHHPIYERGAVFSCTRNDGTAEYVVESAPYEPWWKVKTPENHEVCRVKAERMWSGLLFNAGLPHRLVVYKGTEPRAEIRHRPGLTTPRTEIEAYSDRRTYHVRQGAIFYGGQLVGRLYYARQAFHLDIHQDHFNEGTLGYFVTLT